jgi:hypothetical protein
MRDARAHGSGQDDERSAVGMGPTDTPGPLSLWCSPGEVERAKPAPESGPPARSDNGTQSGTRKKRPAADRIALKSHGLWTRSLHRKTHPDLARGACRFQKPPRASYAAAACPA